MRENLTSSSWQLVSELGLWGIFLHKLFIKWNSSCKICHTVSLLVFSMSATIRMTSVFAHNFTYFLNFSFSSCIHGLIRTFNILNLFSILSKSSFKNTRTWQAVSPNTPFNKSKHFNEDFFILQAIQGSYADSS